MRILTAGKRMVGTTLARLCPPCVSTFEFERDFHLGAVGFDLALGVQLQIELHDFGDAKIAQGFSGPVDRRCGGLFPGILAGTDQLNHLVDALSHVVLPLVLWAGRRWSCRGSTYHRWIVPDRMRCSMDLGHRTRDDAPIA